MIGDLSVQTSSRGNTGDTEIIGRQGWDLKLISKLKSLMNKCLDVEIFNCIKSVMEKVLSYCCSMKGELLKKYSSGQKCLPPLKKNYMSLTVSNIFELVCHLRSTYAKINRRLVSFHSRNTGENVTYF